MPPQYIGQPAMPAVALAAEHRRASRELRSTPPGRARKRSYAGPPLLVRQPLQPQHQLHVLADGVVQVSAGVEHRVAPEEAERARDDDVAAEPVPAEPAEQERAQVLDHLDAGQQLASAPRASITRPCLTSEPLTTRMVPPVGDDVRCAYRNGRTIRCSASASISVSASIAHTSSPRAKLSPTFSASALPPFSLSTTTSAGISRGAVEAAHRLGLDALLVDGLHRHQVEPVSISTWTVSSFEPSLMTMTSSLG